MQKIIKRRDVDSLAPFAGAGSELPPILQRIYASRGVETEVDLKYDFTHLLKPEMKGLDEALTLLVFALENNQKILILGDFDADGATSTAFSVRCLKSLGHLNVEYLVPNRFEYGYGLTPEIVDVASELKPDLIVTVDNGISSIQGVEHAHSLGIKVLVTDHHLPGRELPKADAIVNPNQDGCNFSSKAAAGVGVIFYVMSALRARLRAGSWFSELRPEPNFAKFLDLVALGTVADVVPLDVNNRILVFQGLKRMRAGLACPGINAILQVAGKTLSQLQASDLGFAVGPRLNAAGRLDDMALGIRCLLADTDSEAMAIAQELDDLNKERRAIEGSMQVEALVALESMGDTLNGDLPNGVCLYRDDWHQGVIGILASRIKDKLHRPVIVFAESSEDEIKGSGRSIQGVHMRDVLDEIATSNPGLLSKFGGHAMAAGLSLEKNKRDVFTREFDRVVTQHVGEMGLQPIVETDGALGVQEFSMALADQLQQAGPWGQAFPEPTFDGEFWLESQKIVGEKHLKLVLAPIDDRQNPIDAIAFNVDVTQWPNHNCQKVRVVYKLSINEFRGRRTLQLMVDYLEAKKPAE